MKHRFGFVIAVGVGLFCQASALAQQPVPPPPVAPSPAPSPAEAPSDKPPADAAPPTDTPPGDSVAGQTDPNTPPAPRAPEPTPNAPPPPPQPGATNTAPPVPPPVTLPPYLTGGPSTITIIPPLAPRPTTTAPPAPGPGADAGVSPRKPGEAYLRWRGSGVSWNHAVSTTALGVGADYNSGDNQQYTQGFSATLNYFLIEPKDAQGRKRGYSVRAATNIAFDVELTNSDSTKQRYEKQFRDIPLSVVFSKPLYRSADEQTGIAIVANGTAILPTARTSYEQGVYFGLSPRATLMFSVPLRGKDASFLKGATLGLSTSYTHRFARAETPTNPDLGLLRQSTTGSLIVSDQLSGRSLSSNNMRVGGWGFLSEKLFGKELWIFFGGGASYQFLNAFDAPPDGCSLELPTGCATAEHTDNPSTTRIITDFGIGLTYFPSADWGVGIGYDNATGQLGQNGQWRNPFFSPDAQFNASVILSVDAIVERLQGNVREDPVIYFGQNRQKPAAPRSRSVQAVF